MGGQGGVLLSPLAVLQLSLAAALGVGVVLLAAPTGAGATLGAGRATPPRGPVLPGTPAAPSFPLDRVLPLC